MNNVLLIGRLTKDPAISYTPAHICVAKFSLAIDRGKDKDGKEKGTDYPNCIAFGKTAEIAESYITKGKQIGVTGHIQTGSYKDKEGRTVYTTDVVVDRIDLLNNAKPAADDEQICFERINDDLPF